MSYTALYRKFRPVEFEDVKGQEHIITTLKNQIEANRIGQTAGVCDLYSGDNRGSQDSDHDFIPVSAL